MTVMISRIGSFDRFKRIIRSPEELIENHIFKSLYKCASIYVLLFFYKHVKIKIFKQVDKNEVVMLINISPISSILADHCYVYLS